MEIKLTPRAAIRTPDSLPRNSHDPLIAQSPSDAPLRDSRRYGDSALEYRPQPRQERDVTDRIDHLAYPSRF
jgi:hypothetical protein